jgi:opacity protein-like surface antigen
VVGFEIANMLSQTTKTQDRLTGLRVEQQTTQDYYRLYLGGQLGSHGHGLIRPHVGSNIALVVYSISTDVVVPDDANRENEIRQNLRSHTESGFGWDVTLGTDFNIKDKWAVEGGVRFLKSFGVPQQLGAGTVRVEPAYFQIYLGVGASFGALKGKTDD